MARPMRLRSASAHLVGSLAAIAAQAALAGLAAPLAACGGGGDPVAVSVQMALDPATCGAVPDPSALDLTCAATAGVWLRRASTGEVLERACVDFGGDAPTLADLPSLLADVDLATASSADVSVDVAVYAPWQSASGCPTLDEVAPSGDAQTQVVVSGSSGGVDLSASPALIEVELACGPIAAPGDAAACESDCKGEQDDCYDDSELADCEDKFDLCEEDCSPDDDLCDAQCESNYTSCVTASPVGACQLDFDSCAEDCSAGDDGCFTACDEDYDTCQDAICQDLFDSCTSGCDGDGQCAVAAS